MDGVLGVITCFAGNFEPRDFAFCNGQSIAISSNQTLFSLIGTTYGGDGITTFKLPDLRGRAPVSSGQGLSSYSLAQQKGAETSAMTAGMLPPHSHSGPVLLYLMADNSGASPTPTPDFAYPASINGGYAVPSNLNTMQAPVYSDMNMIPTGNSSPADIQSPYLAINYIICVNGLFPSHN
ncbi:MAG: tail fiber protein [Bacteroidota bacterium]